MPEMVQLLRNLEGAKEVSSPRFRLLVVLSVVFATLPFIVGAGNGDGGNSDAARAEHQRIIDFWTPERVAQAVPRDFIFDPGTRGFSPSKGKPSNRGGGGGGGGNSTTLVTGSSWNGGGGIDGSVGKVLFAMNGSYWVCSATVISDSASDRSLILTAAHCVYDEANYDVNDEEAAFATNWMFIPDYDAIPVTLSTRNNSFCDDTLWGCWTALAMAVHIGYAGAGSFGAGVEYDFAVVAVGEGGKTNEPQLDANVTAQQYSFSEDPRVDDGTDTYAFGYPAQKKWDGTDLIYCRGPIDTDPHNNNETYRLNECKLNGGSSGGSWLIDSDETDGFDFDTVISVNSYGYRGITAMHGPILNGNTQAVYNAALVAVTDTVATG